LDVGKAVEPSWQALRRRRDDILSLVEQHASAQQLQRRIH